MMQKKLNKLEERCALGIVEDVDVYRRLKAQFWNEINGINDEVRKVDLKLSNLDNLVTYSVKLSSKLNVMWDFGTFELKQRLQNLVFPEGVTCSFENNISRTCRSNSVFTSIASQSRVWLNEETGTTDFFIYNSGLVVSTGIEPVSKV